MENVFLILAIGFGCFMVVAMFKYANFIHHYPKVPKEEKNNSHDSKKKSPPNI